MNAFAEAVKTKPNKPNQTQFLTQKPTCTPKINPKNHHFSIILDNSSLQFLSASGGIVISIDRKQLKESPA